MEDKFFFIYDMKMNPEVAMRMPIPERKWYVQRYVKQKQAENDAMEAAKKKAKAAK